MLVDNPISKELTEEKEVIITKLHEKLSSPLMDVIAIPFSIIQRFGKFYKSSSSLPEPITSSTNSRLINELQIGQHLVIAPEPQYIDAGDEKITISLDIFNEHALLYSKNPELSQAIPLSLKAPKISFPIIWFKKSDYFNDQHKVTSTKIKIEYLLNEITNWDCRSIHTLSPLISELDNLTSDLFVTKNINDDRMNLTTIKDIIAPPSIYPSSGRLPLNRALDMNGDGIYYGDDTKPITLIKEAVPNFKHLSPVNLYLRQILTEHEITQYYSSKVLELMIIFETGAIARTESNFISHYSYLREIRDNADHEKTLDIQNEYHYSSQKIIAILEIQPYQEIMNKEWINYNITSYPSSLTHDEHVAWVKSHLSDKEKDYIYHKALQSYNSPAEEKLKLLEKYGYPEHWSITLSTDPRSIKLSLSAIPTTLDDFVNSS
jgi:hypothetical protein